MGGGMDRDTAFAAAMMTVMADEGDQVVFDAMVALERGEADSTQQAICWKLFQTTAKVEVRWEVE